MKAIFVSMVLLVVLLSDGEAAPMNALDALDALGALDAHSHNVQRRAAHAIAYPERGKSPKGKSPKGKSPSYKKVSSI